MAHYDLGALLLNQNNRNAAIDHLRRATELKPDFSDGHYNLALALWMSGAYDAARREINAAFELNPADDQTTRLRAMMTQASPP
jgi:Flp pilus assembly protein TadD